MKNKKLLSALTVLLLIQGISLPLCGSAETLSLNPASRISEPSFRQISAAICLAVLFYKQDVLSPASRQDIISEFARLNGGDVRFDLQKIAINDILRGCEIKPHKVYSTRQVEISP